MGFNNIVSEDELLPGHHIYCYRGYFTYAHHGIFIGDAQVIHFVGDKNEPKMWCSSCKENTKGRNGVFRSCLECFGKGYPLRRFVYGASVATCKVMRAGTCSTAKEEDAAVVIARAKKALQHGFPRYDLLRNNCEIFCMYCTTGSVKAPDDFFSSSSSGSGQVRFVINTLHMASAAATLVGQALEWRRRRLEENEDVDANERRQLEKSGSAEGLSSSFTSSPCLLQKQSVGLLDSLAMTGFGKALSIAGIVGCVFGTAAAVRAQPQPTEEYEGDLSVNNAVLNS